MTGDEESEEDETQDAEGDGDEATDGAVAVSSSHRRVTEEMVEDGVTEAFIVPAEFSQQMCAKAGVQWTADHAKYADRGVESPATIVQIVPNMIVADYFEAQTSSSDPDEMTADDESDQANEKKEEKEKAKEEEKESLVHLRWMERPPTPPPSEPFSPEEDSGGSATVGLTEVRIDVVCWEEGRNVDGFWSDIFCILSSYIPLVFSGFSLNK